MELFRSELTWAATSRTPSEPLATGALFVWSRLGKLRLLENYFVIVVTHQK